MNGVLHVGSPVFCVLAALMLLGGELYYAFLERIFKQENVEMNALGFKKVTTHISPSMPHSLPCR